MKKLKEKIQALSMIQRRTILYAHLAVSVVLLLLGYFGSDALFVLSILILFLMLFYCLLAFRCPDCGAYLGERMIGYSHCPKCGKLLEK